MRLREVDTAGLDPNAAATGGGLYGLGQDPDETSVVLVPAPWDVTTSYRPGTAGGPALILRASQQIDLRDAELASVGLERPYRFGIAMTAIDAAHLAANRQARVDAEKVLAVGGVIGGDGEIEAALARVNAACADFHADIAGRVRRHLDAGQLVGVVGGDHSVAFGAIQACAERHPGLGILHIDAHADLRHAYEGFAHSHASIFDKVLNEVPGVATVTQVGVRDLCDEEARRIEADERVICFLDHEVRIRRFEGETWQSIGRSIVSTLPRDVYVSFDIDGLDPSLCPHTGTPVPGGLFFNEAVYLFRCLFRMGKRIVGFDLNEVSGGPDDDDWDGNVGARLLYKLIGFGLLSHGARS